MKGSREDQGAKVELNVIFSFNPTRVIESHQSINSDVRHFDPQSSFLRIDYHCIGRCSHFQPSTLFP
jgi:hypothetical protein